VLGVRAKARLAASALGCVVLFGSVPAAPQEVVTLPHKGILAVRAPGQLDVAAIDAIADYGAKQVVKFSAFDAVADFIARKCGRPSITVPVHPRYRERLISQNMNSAAADSDPLQLTEDRTLTVPACASSFALERAEFDAPNGIQALMKKLSIPFDMERYRRLTSAPNFKAAVADEYLRLGANPYPDGQVCNAPDLVSFFGCVNAIEIAFINRDRIKSTAQIVGRFRVFVVPVEGAKARVPVAAEKADQLAALAILETDSEKIQYQKANGITNITVTVAPVAGAPAQPIAGVGEVQITAPAVPVAAGDGSQVPAPLPLTVPASLPQAPAKAVSTAAAPVPGTIEHDVKFLTAVDDLTKFDPACTNAHELNKGRWPFDRRELERVLALSFSLNPDQVETPRLLVVDTGFDFTYDENKTPPVPERYIFPKDNFARNRDDSGDGINGPHVGFAGVNLATRLPSSATHTLDNTRRRSHGLAVTTLALGGRDAEFLRRLRVLKTQVGIASLISTANPEIVLNQAHIQRIMDYAAASGNDFRIINLSLSTRDRLEGFQNQMRNEGMRVFVAAAGNDDNQGKALHNNDEAVFPAALGGSPTSNTLRASVVITVGAHKGDGKWAGFSYFSDKKVDLLAPGCMVPSYELQRSGDAFAEPLRVVESFVSGTSFAAPLVSFFASVLMSDVRLREPGTVKERVLVGTDFDFELAARAFSSGRLNPAKMLSARYDVLETIVEGKRQLRFGDVKNKSSLPDISCGGVPVKFKEIRKLALDSSNNKVLLLSSSDPIAPSNLEKAFCDPTVLAGVTYEFDDAETGEEGISFNAATQVIDYVSKR
jgi:hypothetical protein